MNSNKFNNLKNQVQEVIDLMAIKDFIEANFKLRDAGEDLDELLYLFISFYFIYNILYFY